MDVPFYQEQTTFLYWIASWRNEWLNPFFQFLNYFDSIYFIMALIPFVWVGVSYRWGMRLGFLLIFNVLLNCQLKLAFDMPRPIVANPDLAMLPFSSPGWPSGAAEQSMLLGGLLIHEWKSKWAWVIGIGYVALISFSRLYLGVHYPTDLLGGWIVGLLLLFVYLKSKDPLEKWVAKPNNFPFYLLAIVFFLLYFYFLSIPDDYPLLGAALGFWAGSYLFFTWRLPCSCPKQWHLRVLRGFAAIISACLGYLVVPKELAYVHSFMIAVWISLGATPLCRALFPTSSKR